MKYYNDRFKFRAWKVDKDFILMHSTGLRDKNDKLIYEGDIVKHINGVKVVLWDDKSLSFQMSLSDYILDQELGYDNIDIEILGNIHENPELLEEL